MDPEIHIATDMSSLWEEAAVAVTGLLKEAALEKPSVSVALSGGGTPRGLYRRLAAPPYRNMIPWQRLEWFWGTNGRCPRTIRTAMPAWCRKNSWLLCRFLRSRSIA